MSTNYYSVDYKIVALCVCNVQTTCCPIRLEDSLTTMIEIAAIYTASVCSKIAFGWTTHRCRRLYFADTHKPQKFISEHLWRNIT